MSKKSLMILLVGVALAIGAVQIMHRPDRAFGPDIHTKTVAMGNGQRLHVQTREVTVAQWQACHGAGQCTLELKAHDKDVDYPATGLSYPDTMEYLYWINANSDTAWRLPTADEWTELAQEVMPQQADPIFTDPSLTWASAYLMEANATGRALRPSGAFSATSAGIEDLDGNVWEWTQDCYAGASGQGTKTDPARCPAYIMGGEHEAVMSYLVRDPARGGCAVGATPAHLGMRMVSDEG
ncbi:nitrate reductase [Sulfitobacter sp. SK012]|nr:nitrate reductase [Sulfitobacter sp. SK012]